jgi:hypothetical protein
MINEDMLVLEAWDLLAGKGIASQEMGELHSDLIALGIHAGVMTALAAFVRDLEGMRR